MGQHSSYWRTGPGVSQSCSPEAVQTEDSEEECFEDDREETIHRHQALEVDAVRSRVVFLPGNLFVPAFVNSSYHW